MSCPDSQVFREDKSFASGDMGDVLGKESDDAEGDEVSQEFKDCTILREDADGATSLDETDVDHDALDEMVNKISLNDFNEDHNTVDEDSVSRIDDNEQPAQQDANGSQNPPNQRCTCDTCNSYRSTFDTDSVEEMKMAQSRWMELRQYIRGIYRMAMEGNTGPVQPYQPHIKELVNRLCNRNPHLLFQRLEAQVQEFVIEAKVRQLELLHREKQTPQLSRMFLTGLLDSYKKLMSAATQLAPLLEQLQKVHLNKFNVTWKVLNQHLYQSCVYTDPLVQNNVPLFISELSKCNDENAEARKLVHDFLSFDDEITLVGGMWRDAETRIHQYNQEQATLKAKERMLKEDWKIFKEQRKLFQQKMWNKAIISEIYDSDGESDDINLTGHRGCPCEECTMTHIFCGGLVTPPHSPGLPSYSSGHKIMTDITKVEGENQEGGATVPAGDLQSCECHVCTAPPMNIDSDCDSNAGVIMNTSPGSASASSHVLHSATGTGVGCGGAVNGGSGFHLYPHIHGTGGGGGSATTGTNVNVGSSVYPHLYNIHTTLLQHHNSITGLNVPMNGSNIDQSVTTTPQPAVNTTTTITTTTVVNDNKQVTTDCDPNHSNYISSSVNNKPVNVTTRPGTPPPPSPRPLGVLKYNSGVSVINSNGTSNPVMAKSIAQHSNGSASVPVASHHQQQQQRTHRHSTTQTTPQPQQSQSIAASQSVPGASPTLPLSDHHSLNVNNVMPGHPRLHQHQPAEQHNNINSKVPQTGSSMPQHSCHKHAEPIKRVSSNDPHAADDEDSVSPEDSCSERSTSTQRDSRHCDCCYCEVFGHGVPSVAPVSRNYQEMRERLRQLLTKKKAKCKAAAASNSSSTNHNVNNINSNSNSSSPSSVAVHASSSPLLTSSISSSSSSSSSLSSTKLSSNSAPPTNGVVTNSTPSAATSSLATVDVQKDPRDLEDLLDFIEGNPSGKCKDAKKAAKKARQKQKKQEEIDRKKREEEEAERRRQELIIQQQKQQAALLKKQQQQQKQKKKDKGGSKKNSNNNNNNNNRSNTNSNNGNSANSNSGNSTSNGPQMVTIKRVMEPNSAEPTVTITLRGATPSEDKVLYTLLNGQVCQVQKEKNSKGKQSVGNGNTKGKNNNNNNISNCNNKNTIQQQNKKNANNNSTSSSSNSNNNLINNSKNCKKDNVNTVHIQMNGHTNNHHNSNSSVINKKLTKPSLSAVRNGNVNMQMPPNTTSQVPPPAASSQLTSPTAIQINNAINRLSSSKPNMGNFNLDNLKLPPGITITKVDPSTVQQRRPPPQTRQQAAPAGTMSAAPTPPPTVAPPKSAASNVIVVDTGRLKDLTSLQHNEFSRNIDEVPNSSNGKKKKKNKKGTNNGTVNSSTSNRTDIASVVGGGGSVTLLNRAQSQPQNGKILMPQAAAIIKVNGSMVTIRSPALQQALANKTEAVTVVNGNGAGTNDQNKKRRKKKKGANGQGQPDEWNLVDSVFAPKDIDLDNGDIDDAERELEAFKRFCLQSVPPKQKEKVHLNIKDIVLKKKASAISCS